MRRAAFATLLTVALLGFSHVETASAQTTEVMPTIEDAVRNVALENVQNVRDLGGLRGSHGYIPHGQFYRSATLVRANGQDRTVLSGRGINLDIDLRTEVEAIQHGDTLSSDQRFNYQHLSLLGVGIADWFRGLHGLYLHALADHQGGFRDVFHAMAAHKDGAVLYHCTSGKDRTGMVTAILLDLAGVDRATIVRDYAISASYLKRSSAASPPDVIGGFLDALHSKYGGAHAFLTHIGLPESEISALLVKLGQA